MCTTEVFPEKYGSFGQRNSTQLEEVLKLGLAREPRICPLSSPKFKTLTCSKECYEKIYVT